MNIINDLNNRYATKVFDPKKKLSKEQLHTLTESLRLSPSSFGLQPWKFLVIEDQKVKDSLVPHTWNQKQVADASHTIVICIKNQMNAHDVDLYVRDIARQRGVKEKDLQEYSNMMKGFIAAKSQEQQQAWMAKQAYIALGFLMTTAAHMGIDSCPIEGFVPAQYDKLLKLEGYKSLVVCPVGYRASSDKYQDLKKVRFNQHEVIKFI
jgi:nitroreductase